MKQLLFIFNCHGGEMKKLLRNSDFIKNNIHITCVSIYRYIPQRYDKEEFPTEVIQLLKNADILIVQQMRSDRGWLNTENTIKLVKKNCKIIKIPHYTFSGYWYPYDILNDEKFDINKSYEELNNYANNLFLNEEENIKKHLENELNHIKELDKLSDIKMYDFVKNNYKKDRLFFSRRYPQSPFFYHMCKEILKILNIKEKMPATFSGYADKNNDPILPTVHKILNLKFKPHMGKRKGINYPCNIVEYFVYAKQSKKYPFQIGSRGEAARMARNKIQIIIDSKKYR